MAVGRRSIFTSAYVTVRILRETLDCDLPIELFYGGKDELPQEAIDYFRSIYRVRV